MDKITTYCGIIAYRMSKKEAKAVRRLTCCRCTTTPETGFLVPLANKYFCERHFREFNHSAFPWFFSDADREIEQRIIKAVEAAINEGKTEALDAIYQPLDEKEEVIADEENQD